MPEYPRINLAAQRPGLSHCVYRFLDAEGVVLYVGSTGNVWYRIGQHAADREWWPEVAWDRTVVELVSEATCPGRSCRAAVHAEMLRHEERLIKDLQPRYNMLLTGYCRKGLHLLAEVGLTDGRCCRACNSEWHRQYYIANREKFLAAASANYQANRDKKLEYNKRPEVKAREKAWKSSPLGQAKVKEYEARPEVRARRAAARRRKARPPQDSLLEENS